MPSRTPGPAARIESERCRSGIQLNLRRRAPIGVAGHCERGPAPRTARRLKGQPESKAGAENAHCTTEHKASGRPADPDGRRQERPVRGRTTPKCRPRGRATTIWQLPRKACAIAARLPGCRTHCPISSHAGRRRQTLRHKGNRLMRERACSAKCRPRWYKQTHTEGQNALHDHIIST